MRRRPIRTRPAASSSIALPLLVAGAAWLALREIHYARWTDDDAFISFRYARNLVQGHGLVFNAGERVMGYTNFLWTVLVAGAMRLGIEPVAFARGLGVASSFAAAALLATFGRAVRPAQPEGGSPPAPRLDLAAPLLLFLEPWAIWAVGGLENVFAGLLVLGAFLLYFGYLENRRAGAVVGAGSLCAAAALCHPSYALMGLVLGTHLAALTRRGAARPAALAAFAAPLAVTGVLFLAWMRAYYGDFVPNTFHAKVGWTLDVLVRGLQYLAAAAIAFPWLALSAAAALAPGLRAAGDARPRLLLAAIAGYAAYGIAIGGEEFHAFRLVVAILPLGCLLAQYVGTWAVDRARWGSRPAARWGAALAIVALGGVSAGWAPRVRGIDFDIARDFSSLCRAGALELKRRFPPGTLFAHSGAGAMAYYTEFRFLDTLGLNDSTIAHRKMPHMGRGGAGHEKGDGRYVLSRRPDLVMFSGLPLASPVPLGLPGDFELFELPGFRAGYALDVIRFPFTPRGGEAVEIEMPVYVRRGGTMN